MLFRSVGDTPNKSLFDVEKEEAAKQAAWENDQLPPDQEAPPESGPPEPQAAGEDTKQEGPEAPKTAALEEK